jgi:hypothetical protein
VGEDLEARRGKATLGGPWGTTLLGGRAARGGEEIREALTELTGSYHGHHSGEDGTDGNGADLTGGRCITILPQGYQATT